MRNVEMRGLFNNRRTGVWIVVLILAAAGVLEVNPVQAGVSPNSWRVLSERQRSLAGLLKPFGECKADIAKRASEASAGSRRAPANEAQASGASKLRDPFKAPEPPPTASTGKGKRSHLPVVLPPGVRGLLIDQLILEGVVDKKPDNAMIAVVTNKTNRAYFLRVNEQVFDGTVTMITPAAVYFRQQYYTGDDKVAWRTVEKHLSPGPGGKK